MKKLTALVLLASLVFTFAACSTDDSGVTTTTPAATTTTKPTTTTKKPPVDLPEDPTDEGDWMEDLCELYIPYGTATIDGTKDDSWANAATVTLDKVKKDSPAADTAVSASVMWNEEGLFFLFEITDSDIYMSGAVGDYNNDSIYLYVSEDPNANINDFNMFGSGIYQFALINEEMEMLPRKGADGTTNLSIERAYTVTDTGLLIEFKYKPVQNPVAAGNFLLLDYQYNDSGASGTRKGGMGWFNGTDTNADVMLWAVVKLLAQGENAPA
jgi:hypothetical protein